MTELLYALMLSVSGVGVLLGHTSSLLRGQRRYELRDSLTNLTLYAGFFAINLVWAHVVFAIYVAASDHAVVQLTIGAWHLGQHGLWWEWVLLFVLEDLCFYCFHRASHRIRFFWASHVTHHSSQFFNLSVAFRQTWIPFPGVLFWLPLALLGFDPLMIMSVQVVSLFYQELLHTQAVPRLGPLELVFNTPTHHAVHHACNAPYIDKNYGGILIVWDRLLGTFAERQEPLRFGLTKNISHNRPIHAAFHGFAEMLADLWKTGSWRVLLASPESTPARKIPR